MCVWGGGGGLTHTPAWSRHHGCRYLSTLRPFFTQCPSMRAPLPTFLANPRASALQHLAESKAAALAPDEAREDYEVDEVYGSDGEGGTGAVPALRGVSGGGSGRAEDVRTGAALLAVRAAMVLL